MIKVDSRKGDFYTVASNLRRCVAVVAISGSLLVPIGLRADDDTDRAGLLKARHDQLMRKWEAQFRAADTDHDGKLTRAEMEAAKMPDSLLHHFDEIDTDHDGGLSPEEMIAAYDRRLARQAPDSGAE